MSEKLSLEDLKSLPWTRQLMPDEITQVNSRWFAYIKELEGCITEGATMQEALANLDEALTAWLEAALEQGIPIPRPEAEEESDR